LKKKKIQRRFAKMREITGTICLLSLVFFNRRNDKIITNKLTT